MGKRQNENVTRVLATVTKEEFEKDYRELKTKEVLEKYEINYNNLYALLDILGIKKKEKVVIDNRTPKIKLTYPKPELTPSLVEFIRNTDTEIARYIWGTIKEFYE